MGNCWKSRSLLFGFFLCCMLAASLAAGAASVTAAVDTTTAAGAGKSIVLSTTTSTQQTGLLDVLLPAFTKATGIEVKPIAVGTGKALELGRNGDADVVMVHARKLEDKFVADGIGTFAWDLMFNDFVIVGPAEDPAHVKGASGTSDSLKRILDAKVVFISRADKSGTHERELELWKTAGLTPSGDLYVQAGQGMSETLVMAGEKKGYTLCDRATWLSMRKKLPLVILYENPAELRNDYGVIAVDSAKVKTAKTADAIKFIEWVTAAEAGTIIEGFKMDGEILFHLNVKPR
ncbi:MAG: substrate-binding domain-containing protein [Candidatus Ozemobacteraceae bacterium]